MPNGQPDNAQLDFWDEVRKVIDENPDGVAFVVFKMKYGIDLHVDELRTLSVGSTTLIIFYPQGGQTMIDANNIYSAYVALKD